MKKFLTITTTAAVIAAGMWYVSTHPYQDEIVVEQPVVSTEDAFSAARDAMLADIAALEAERDEIEAEIARKKQLIK